jgi:hypothetical protein
MGAPARWRLTVLGQDQRRLPGRCTAPALQVWRGRGIRVRGTTDADEDGATPRPLAEDEAIRVYNVLHAAALREGGRIGAAVAFLLGVFC